MFIACDTGTSANAIASKIKVALSDLGLDLENVFEAKVMMRCRPWVEKMQELLDY